MKNKRLQVILLLVTTLLMFSLSVSPVLAQGKTPKAVVVKLEGPLTPVWSGYLERGIEKAKAEGAELLVVELNTPGGSVDLMNSLISQILTSPVPVVVYVSPRGSMAASAGTLMVLAGQAAAMAPESAIGAASPVGSQGEDLGTTIEAKTKEILKASARSLAERRGQAAVTLVEETIESAKAVSSSEALEAGLIDFVAVDLDDLMRQLNGFVVEVGGNEVQIYSEDALLLPVSKTMIEDILGLLTNPNIVFLLLSIGVQAILIEISSPGGWFAGFVGATLLALAIYGLGILPVNWFGLIFLIIAFILFILDIKAPTHGALTIAGTGSFIAGALILFNSARVPGFSNVSIGLVVGMGVFLGLSFFAVVMIAVRAMRTPVVTGRESLSGKKGVCVSKLDPTGIVQVAGEQWSAQLVEGQPPIKKGERIIVEQVEGVRLVVRRDQV